MSSPSNKTLSVKKPLFDLIFPNQSGGCTSLSRSRSFFSRCLRKISGRLNAGEIVRLAVEIGLLAIALTPVIVTGGIDLSVGSLMGLCAVILGSRGKMGLGIVPSRSYARGRGLGRWIERVGHHTLSRRAFDCHTCDLLAISWTG